MQIFGHASKCHATVWRVEVQPLIDKVVAKLLNWKAKLLDRHGLLTLVNYVLSLIPVHFLIVFPIKKWTKQD